MKRTRVSSRVRQVLRICEADGHTREVEINGETWKRTPTGWARTVRHSRDRDSSITLEELLEPERKGA